MRKGNMVQDSKTSQMAVSHESNRTVAEAYANQVDYCRNNGATITARIVAAIAGQLDRPDPGAFVARIRDWIVMEAPTGHRFCVIRAQTKDFDAKANTWEDGA